jgi:hypothetical protein
LVQLTAHGNRLRGADLEVQKAELNENLAELVRVVRAMAGPTDSLHVFFVIRLFFYDRILPVPSIHAQQKAPRASAFSSLLAEIERPTPQPRGD